MGTKRTSGDGHYVRMKTGREERHNMEEGMTVLCLQLAIIYSFLSRLPVQLDF